MTNQQSLEPMTGARANRLCVIIETIAEDLHTSITVDHQENRDTQEVTGFEVSNNLPIVTIPLSATEAESARAIAKQLDQWSEKLAAVASQIRIRFEK